MSLSDDLFGWSLHSHSILVVTVVMGNPHDLPMIPSVFVDLIPNFYGSSLPWIDGLIPIFVG